MVRVRGFIGTVLLLLALGGCVGQGGPAGPRYVEAAAQVPAVPPDRARFFFFRDYEPYESLARPYIRLNGDIVGFSVPGGVWYRDMPPGTYKIAADSPGLYPNQDKSVTVAAGDTIFVQVQSYKSYNSGFDMYDPDTFVIVIIDAAQGRRAIDTMRYVTMAP